MLDFFNSVGFQTVVEFLVGVVALVVYWFQKKDRLRCAAMTLLLEIQQAERAVVRAKEYIRRGDLNVDLHILRSDTWDLNKYLFTKVLDKDEWDSITEFYDKARLLDESINYAKRCFDNDVEQIRTNKQRMLAEIARETIERLQSDGGINADNAIKDMQRKMNAVDALYMSQQGQASYNPQKTIDDAKNCVEDFTNISTTSVGQKLKRIARYKKFLS